MIKLIQTFIRAYRDAAQRQGAARAPKRLVDRLVEVDPITAQRLAFSFDGTDSSDAERAQVAELLERTGDPYARRVATALTKPVTRTWRVPPRGRA